MMEASAGSFPGNFEYPGKWIQKSVGTWDPNTAAKPAALQQENKARGFGPALTPQRVTQERSRLSRRGHVTGLAAVSFGNVAVRRTMVWALGVPPTSREPRGLAARPIILHGGAAQQSHLHARGAPAARFVFRSQPALWSPPPERAPAAFLKSGRATWQGFGPALKPVYQLNAEAYLAPVFDAAAPRRRECATFQN